MNSLRTLSVAALIYGGSFAVTAVTPAKADAQVVTSYYNSPYGGYYNYNYGVTPIGYSSYYNYGYNNPGYYPYRWSNWGGNTTPSGYPQWYVNYARWNRPYNANYYNPYRWRRW